MGPSFCPPMPYWEGLGEGERMNGYLSLEALKTKKAPRHLSRNAFVAPPYRKITRSVSFLLAKKIERHESIRPAIEGVYETDKLHSRIMGVNSLGYGNHPLF